MAEVNLVAEPGRTTGSSASRRLRHAGRVPAVVYGHGMKPVPVSVVARDLRTALSVHGLNQVLTLDVDGSTHLVLARQLQRHPVRHTLSHVDFQVVRRDEIVSAEVPLVLVGAATKVEQERGLLEHTLTSLSVRSTPEQIPQEIAVDVSGLEIGASLRVRDLVLPRGVTTDVDPDELVVIAAASTVAAALAAEAAAEEAAEVAAEAFGPAAAETPSAAEAPPAGTASAEEG
jgi:large subunit ribosomal protein L25